MTREDIIELAWDAGLNFDSYWSGQIGEIGINHLEIFAQLLAQVVKDAADEHHMNDVWQAIKIEREACAMMADVWKPAYPHPSCVIADTIRARVTV
jgi:hypothetical protein